MNNIVDIDTSNRYISNIFIHSLLYYPIIYIVFKQVNIK